MITNEQKLNKAIRERDERIKRAVEFVKLLERWEEEQRPKTDILNVHEFCVVKEIKELAEEMLF